jgi:CheY-like chemotaxis protein
MPVEIRTQSMPEAEVLRVASVDDDPAEHVIMSMAITRAEYPTQVSYYNSGTSLLEALDLLAPELRPDVILLDLRMPLMSGYDTLDRLQTNPEYCHIPAVILTSSTRPVEREMALRHGAALFHSKPDDLPTMATLIDSLPLLVSLNGLS